MIARILNSLSIVDICSTALNLTEIRQGNAAASRTIFQNFFIRTALKEKNGSQHQLLKLCKMVTLALSTLNKILSLSLVDDLGEPEVLSQDFTARRVGYIKGLKCVQYLKSQVSDPSKALQIMVESETGISGQHTLIS